MVTDHARNVGRTRLHDSARNEAPIPLFPFVTLVVLHCTGAPQAGETKTSGLELVDNNPDLPKVIPGLKKK